MRVSFAETITNMKCWEFATFIPSHLDPINCSCYNITPKQSCISIEGLLYIVWPIIYVCYGKHRLDYDTTSCSDYICTVTFQIRWYGIPETIQMNFGLVTTSTLNYYYCAFIFFNLCLLGNALYEESGYKNLNICCSWKNNITWQQQYFVFEGAWIVLHVLSQKEC